MVARWTASVGVRALMKAMIRAYGVEEGRPTWKLMLLSLLYTVGIAITLLTVAGLMVLGLQIMEWLAAQVGLQEIVVGLWPWLRWPAAIFLMMLMVGWPYYGSGER